MRKFLIAGLGNPEKKYVNTRHNTGFEAADAVSSITGIEIKEEKHKAVFGSGIYEGNRLYLIKPQTYMNSSGEAVRECSSYYDIPAENVIILVDDIMLDYGRLRVRKGGSAGGHNGLKSIIRELKNENFFRVRIGAGLLPAGGNMIAHVLGEFNLEQRAVMRAAYENAARAALCLITKGLDETMNLFNGK